MPGETKHGIECSRFEALLSEAIDGQLTGASKLGFEAHARVCTVCGPLIADALAGQQWMKSLAEVEPPAHLLHNILASTSGISSARLRATKLERQETGFGARVRGWWGSFITPTASFVRQPRFVMSFGMIFFSFSLAMSAAGVKASDLASISLRPAAIKRSYYTTQGKVVKFYENIRFVYEIESRVREFRKATTPAQPPPEKTDQKKKTNDTSGQPNHQQERNYSREENQTVLAELTSRDGQLMPATSCGLRAASGPDLVLTSGFQAQSSKLGARSSNMPPDVKVTTNRRFV